MPTMRISPDQLPQITTATGQDAGADYLAGRPADALANGCVRFACPVARPFLTAFRSRCSIAMPQAASLANCAKIGGCGSVSRESATQFTGRCVLQRNRRPGTSTDTLLLNEQLVHDRGDKSEIFDAPIFRIVSTGLQCSSNWYGFGAGGANSSWSNTRYSHGCSANHKHAFPKHRDRPRYVHRRSDTGKRPA